MTISSRKDLPGAGCRFLLSVDDLSVKFVRLDFHVCVNLKHIQYFLKGKNIRTVNDSVLWIRIRNRTDPHQIER